MIKQNKTLSKQHRTSWFHTLVYPFPLTLPRVLTHENNAEVWKSIRWQQCFQELNGRTVGRWGSPPILWLSPTSNGTGVLKMGSKHSYPQTLVKTHCNWDKNRKKKHETSKLEGKRGSEKAVIMLQPQRHNDYLCPRHCLNSKQYHCYPTLLTNINDQQNTAGTIMRKDTGLSSSTGWYHLISRLKQTLTTFFNTPSWVQVISRQMCSRWYTVNS